MFYFVWPIALVVLSNVIYHICAKSLPQDMDPLASMSITYLISAVSSFFLYFVLNRNVQIVQEWRKTNWSPIVLGLVIVGLEVGMLYAYRAGWEVSKASIVQSSALALILLIVGFFLYGEPLSWNKIVGMVVCLAGLFLMNLKQ